MKTYQSVADTLCINSGEDGDGKNQNMGMSEK